MANISDETERPFVEDLSAPDIFAVGAKSFFMLGGNLHISLHSTKNDNSTDPPTQKDVAVGHLVMPIESVEALARKLIAFVDQMKAAAITQTRALIYLTQ